MIRDGIVSKEQIRVRTAELVFHAAPARTWVVFKVGLRFWWFVMDVEECLKQTLLRSNPVVSNRCQDIAQDAFEFAIGS